MSAMIVNNEPLLLAGSFATLCLLCASLALIDFRRGIIPDGLNLAIAGAGLAKAAVAGGATAGFAAGAEAIAVGALFWLFRRLYFALRRIQGLGLGDVKFLAAATPWVGMAAMPMLLLIAALSALLAVGGAQLAGQSLTRQTSLPFGPFLALGLVSAAAAQQWLGLI
jgi:leader peptidase (prepilin peptidase)/N-methyltransferase